MCILIIYAEIPCNFLFKVYEQLNVLCKRFVQHFSKPFHRSICYLTRKKHVACCDKIYKRYFFASGAMFVGQKRFSLPLHQVTSRFFFCHANAPPYREKMTFSTNFSDDQCQAKICDHFPRQTEHVKMGKKALIL